MDREERSAFRQFLARDLEAFDEWRRWSPEMLASYVATQLVQFERAKSREARDPRRGISRTKQRRIAEKIRTLRHEGYPQRQAIAIAYRMEGVSRRAR